MGAGIWGPAEAAVARVVGLLKQFAGAAERGLGGPQAAGRASHRLLEPRLDVGGKFRVSSSAARLPELMDLLQDIQEAGLAVPIVRREIGPAAKVLRSGVRNTFKRPASLAAGGLDERHIDAVHVGAFLAVDFDADEVGVQKGGQLLVLERLALHHMTPMASRVADAQENRFVPAARFIEGLFTPGVPIHRIMLVLKQVRGLLGGQTIGVCGVGSFAFFHAVTIAQQAREGKAA